MNEVMVASIRSILAGVVGWGLFLLWRRFAREDLATWVVGVGFLVRSVLSTVLFFVSWMELPVGRALQLGNGLWFFANDGVAYLNTADRLLGRGLLYVVVGDRDEAAFVYVQLVAVAKLVLGPHVSSGLMINLFSFLAAALVIARWGREALCPRHAVIALFALSLDPSFILWSTQPLKETLFSWLVVLFSYAIWKSTRMIVLPREELDIAAVTKLAMLLTVTVYLMGGVRWQYGLVILVAFVPISTWSAALPGRSGLWWRLMYAFGFFVPMSLAYTLSRPGSLEARFVWFKNLPAWLVRYVEGNRTTFEELFSGASTINAGRVIESLPFSDVLARGAMALMPRAVTESLGLATAAGGRGLWLFAELDTLFLAGFVFVVLRLAWLGRPLRLTRTPIMGFLLTLLLVTLPMLYVVSNFGSLLRYRMMLMLPILLIPLTIRQADEPNSG